MKINEITDRTNVKPFIHLFFLYVCEFFVSRVFLFPLRTLVFFRPYHQIIDKSFLHRACLSVGLGRHLSRTKTVNQGCLKQPCFLRWIPNDPIDTQLTDPIKKQTHSIFYSVSNGHKNLTCFFLFSSFPSLFIFFFLFFTSEFSCGHSRKCKSPSLEPVAADKNNLALPFDLGKLQIQKVSEIHSINCLSFSKGDFFPCLPFLFLCSHQTIPLPRRHQPIS